MYEFIIETDGSERVCRLDPNPLFDEFHTSVSFERTPYDECSDTIRYILSQGNQTVIIHNRKDLARIDRFLFKGRISYDKNELQEILSHALYSPDEVFLLQEYIDFCYCFPLMAQSKGLSSFVPSLVAIVSAPVQAPVLPKVVHLAPVVPEKLSAELDFGF